MLTVNQVAAALHVSTATVYELVRRGELAHARVLNAIRIPERELTEFVARHFGRTWVNPKAR